MLVLHLQRDATGAATHCLMACSASDLQPRSKLCAAQQRRTILDVLNVMGVDGRRLAPRCSLELDVHHVRQQVLQEVLPLAAPVRAPPQKPRRRVRRCGAPCAYVRQPSWSAAHPIDSLVLPWRPRTRPRCHGERWMMHWLMHAMSCTQQTEEWVEGP
jgi:hypothetical protein